MEAAQAKKSKTKTLNIGSKRCKAKLPQYKVGDKTVQVKGKPFPASLIMNRSGAKSKNVEEGPSAVHSLHKEQLNLLRTLKRRKKKYISQTGSQYSMDPSLQISQGPVDARSVQDKGLSETKNIGSPVIIEALSENLGSLSIPQVFKQNQETKKETNGHDEASMLTQSMMSEINETCIIVAESFNLNNNDHCKKNCTEAASPSKANRDLRNSKKSPLKSSTNNCTNAEGTEKSIVNEETPKCINDESIDKKSTSLETATDSKNDMHSDESAVHFYSLRTKVVVVMPKKTRFCFTGKLTVRVIYGAIETYGTLIAAGAGPAEIYSPRGYSNVSIETSEKFSQNSISDIWTSLVAEGVHRKENNKLTADIKQIKPGTVILLLSNLKNKLTKFLNVFYPFRLFPEIKNTSQCSWADPRRAEVVLQANIYAGNYVCKELTIDPRVANEVADKMLTRWRAKEWSCSFMIGGKGVGKSTTTRYLINSLLPESKMVVLLDIDPGQAECTPPGCISYSVIEKPLMGPNFTHLKTPAFQIYIGDVNVARCITRYIEAIKILVSRLMSCPVLSHLPIVVNTMGFTQGIGWDIILFAIKLIHPSFVVQIMSEKPKNNYKAYLSKQVVNRQGLPWAPWNKNIADWRQECDHELIVVRSQAEGKIAPGYDTWNMEAYQQRELVMISYLSEIVQNDCTNSVSRYDVASLSINDTVPYKTPFSALVISIPRASVPPTYVLNVINGNIVALCGIDMERELQHSETVTPSLRVLNRSPLCPCYGFGIVRGVDLEREEIFINTPLPASIMRYVNCLMGCIPVPMALLQFNERKDAAPYIGGSNVLPMSREHRRGYTRIKHQNVQNTVGQ